MEQIIASGSLRQRPADFIARASRGETFIVLHYGRPVAILRPRQPDEVCDRIPATLLWRDLRRALARARRAPVLITWRNAATAVLGPLPEEWRLGEDR